MFQSAIKRFRVLTKAAVLAVVGFGAIVLLAASSCFGESSGVSFIPHNKIRVSSCRYDAEGSSREGPRFEYPKLVLLESEQPIVAYVDPKAANLVFAQIRGKEAATLSSIPRFGRYSLVKWPAVFVRGSRVYVAAVNMYSEKEKEARVFLLDINTGRLALQKDMVFNISGRHTRISRLYGIEDGYIVVGGFDEYYYTPFAWIDAFSTRVDKPFSVSLTGEAIIERQTIEEKGVFDALNREYAVWGDTIGAGWVREDNGRLRTQKHDETVCYSENRQGKGWIKPRKVYSVKGTVAERQVRSLSIAGHKDSGYLLWRDIKQGLYFAEFRGGAEPEVTRIFEMEDAQAPSSSTTAITTDQEGNVYALWTITGSYEYKIYLKARIKGDWTQTVVVAGGEGWAILPDMKVDSRGSIHIAYINAWETQQCFYLNVEKARENGGEQREPRPMSSKGN